MGDTRAKCYAHSSQSLQHKNLHDASQCTRKRRAGTSLGGKLLPEVNQLGLQAGHFGVKRGGFTGGKADPADEA